MKRAVKKALVFTSLILACSFAAGCGKKKEPDAEASQVLKITITPEATPTLAPEQINSDAVTKNGNLTMVNGYLTEEGSDGEQE